jgi:hypothetical protein
MKFRHFDIHARHDALGWLLAGALSVIGIGLLLHLPLMGLSYLALAFIFCPLVRGPVWAKLLIALVGLIAV